jgi:hypothetical protein
MRYTLAQEVIFVILAMAAAFALLSKHPIISIWFTILALAFVYFEHQIVEYVRSA